MNHGINQEKNIKDEVSFGGGVGKVEVLTRLLGRESSGVHGRKPDHLRREPRTRLSGAQEFRMQEGD